MSVTFKRLSGDWATERVVRWQVEDARGPGDVNFRYVNLWREDNRYPGTMAVRRHESGNLELSFDALRHGAQPRKPIIVTKEHAEKLVLSILEVMFR
jgi:hypothetical protein